VNDHLSNTYLEEVGLDVVPGRPLAVWSWTHPGGSTVVAVARECSLATHDQGSINFDGHDADDHIGAWEWVPVTEVSTYDLIPNARKAIQDSLIRLGVAPYASFTYGQAAF
jgi:8-oxo-dGTP pyrophosphatase MutT (NUDIX family)